MLSSQRLRGSRQWCGPLIILAVVSALTSCGRTDSAISQSLAYPRPHDEELGLLTRADFMKAMPGVFLSTTGPISLPDAKRAFGGCDNPVQGLLSRALLDQSFRSEEVTNNDPDVNRIASVMDSRWKSERRYDLGSALDGCGVPMTRVVRGATVWTVTRDSVASTWSTASYRNGDVRILVVLAVGADADPDPGCLHRLIAAWGRK